MFGEISYKLNKLFTTIWTKHSFYLGKTGVKGFGWLLYTLASIHSFIHQVMNEFSHTFKLSQSQSISIQSQSVPRKHRLWINILTIYTCTIKGSFNRCRMMCMGWWSAAPMPLSFCTLRLCCWQRKASRHCAVWSWARINSSVLAWPRSHAI